MIWTPHATVATIVEQNQRFLLVEELSHGRRVFNQPAGHVDENESIFDAAVRETLEETGWKVQLTGFTGTYIYQAPENGVTYYRFCFKAKAEKRITDQLDNDILAAHWMDLRQIKQLGEQLRSPLVIKCIEDALHRPALPLEWIYEHPLADNRNQKSATG
ncbi:MAG: NUDIX hydrolase [Oleiphilaceae bacterium]|nr:NUDIX hydrolase [Oleiphilaceae bacterium]